VPRAHLCLPNRLYPKYAQRSRNVSRENAHNRGLGFVAEDLREPLRSTAFPQPLAGYGWPHVPLYVQSLKMERITLPPRRALPDNRPIPLDAGNSGWVALQLLLFQLLELYPLSRKLWLPQE